MSKSWLDSLITDYKKSVERMNREYERREAKKKVQEAKILSKLPKCDFEPCAICGNKPELKVELLGSNRFTVDVRCNKCDWDNGCNLNSYDMDHIPKEPLMPNPESTWMDFWKMINGWAREEYCKFNSPDWKYQCKVCGKKKRGYDIEYFDVIDGEYYCPECHPKYPYKKYQREGNTVYYRSFDDILKTNGGTIKDYVRVCE